MKTTILKNLIPVLTAALLFSCGQNESSEKKESKTAKEEDQKTEAPAIKKTTGYAPVNGLKMYYEIHGEGKPILLLHGAYMTIPLNWKKMIPALTATGRQVIAVELQGHGRTADVDRPLTYEGMADDVSALLQHLHIDSIDVLGYSLGACTALQVAIRHSQQVRKLVMISGVYQHKGWHPDVRALFPSITPEMFKGSPVKTQYDSLAPDTAHWNIFVKKLTALDMKDFDWKASSIKNIKSPVFFLVGDADAVVMEHAMDMYRLKGGGKMGDLSGLPDSRLAIVPGTSHTGIVERVDWMVPMINEFLDAAPQPTMPMSH